MAWTFFTLRQTNRCLFLHMLESMSKTELDPTQHLWCLGAFKCQIVQKITFWKAVFLVPKYNRRKSNTEMKFTYEDEDMTNVRG